MVSSTSLGSTHVGRRCQAHMALLDAIVLKPCFLVNDKLDFGHLWYDDGDMQLPVPKPSVPPPTVDDKKWCVPKVEATDPELQANIDYVCGQEVNCHPIQLGGACFEPDNVRAHASFVMNAFYQTYSNCYFAGSGMITSTDPSTSLCSFLT